MSIAARPALVSLLATPGDELARAGASILTVQTRQGVGVVLLSATDVKHRELVGLFGELAVLAEKMGGNIVLDVAGVQPLDCTWLNHLLNLHHACAQKGGRLVLAALPAEAEDVVRATSLDKHLTIVATRQSGVKLLLEGEQPTLLERILGTRRAGQKAA